MRNGEIGNDSFEGVGGRVLIGSLSLEMVLTGIGVVGLTRGASYGLQQLDQARLVPWVTALIVSLFLVRIAMNGAAGQWRGSFLSTEGGSWKDTALLTARFAMLCALWILPFEMLGWKPGETAQTLMMVAMGQPGPSVTLTLVALFLMAVSPPVFLIAAVGAPDFISTFNPPNWSRLFGGRMTHLVLVYALCLGGVAVVAVPAMALGMLISLKAPGSAQFVGWGTSILMAGMAVDLLGRLSGFFVNWGLPEAETAAEESPEADASGAWGPYMAPVVSPKLPETPAEPSARIQSHLNVVTSKPALVNPRERIEEIVEWFRREPDRALVELENLQAQYAPDPLVLHSLCLLYRMADRYEQSVAVAGEALSVCLAQGATRLAAEVFAAHVDRAAEFDLDVDTMANLGETLLKYRDPERSESVYRAVLELDPGNRRAIKGMLQVAETCMRQSADPERARAIYTFLLETGGESPFAGFIREGLAQAERRLAG